MTFPRWSLVLTACFTWHCAGTPQTDPPNFDPLQIDAMTSKAIGTVWLTGGPGAVKPAGAILHIVNLDDEGAEVTVVVGPDGSFATSMPADEGDVLRFQVEDGAQRSPTFDLVFDGAELGAVSHPLGCLTTSPASMLVLGPSTSAAVQVRNDCERAVSFSATRLRIQPSAFSVREAPTTLEPGTSGTVVVESAASVADREDVLLIEIDSPVADRRAITLIGNQQ